MSTRARGDSTDATERQLTDAAHGHVLTNVGVWSPDGEWIVYDIRPTPEEFTGTRIELVNTRTSEVRVIFEARHGAACGVASYSPRRSVVALIYGPENPSADWHYGFTRRRGVLVDLERAGEVRSLDAINYSPPFMPGAHRGGSHLHVFSADGAWLSFTYEDEILTRLDESENGVQRYNQRNIGVAVPVRPVAVNRSHPRNNDGDYFCAVVTKTVPYPRFGSDEIRRAFDEAWIGENGYLRSDGTRQRRALAFQGTVVASDGGAFIELFVVDLPDDLTIAGDHPIEGTSTCMPAPPAGVRQRRLTYTEGRNFPGLQGPRHWPRSSPDGSRIAFLMKDSYGIDQFWLISPQGEGLRQLTRNSFGIASAFTWSPDGTWLAHVADHSVCVTGGMSGRTFRLTPSKAGPDAPLAIACVFSPDGSQIAYLRMVTGPQGCFPQVFTVPVPGIDEAADLMTTENNCP